MPRITLTTSRDCEDQIATMVLSEPLEEKLVWLESQLFCIGWTIERIRFDTLFRAAQAAAATVWQVGRADQGKEAWEFLNRIKRSGNMEEFERVFVTKQIEFQTSRIDRVLRTAFVARLSDDVRVRFDEIERGDVLFPSGDRSIELGLTRKEMQEVLNYSDTRFAQFERRFIRSIEGLLPAKKLIRFSVKPISTKHQTDILEEFDKLRKRFPRKAGKERLHIIAEKLNITYAAAHGRYYRALNRKLRGK